MDSADRGLVSWSGLYARRGGQVSLDLLDDRLFHHVFSLSQACGTRRLSSSCCHCCVSVGVLSAHDGPSHACRLVCQGDCGDKSWLSAEQRRYQGSVLACFEQSSTVCALLTSRRRR